MKLKQGLWVVVADGARATVFVNEGTAFEPSLQTVRTYDEHHAKTSEMGDGKPSRTFESTGHSRSAMETPDLHQRAEDRFVDNIMGDLARDAADGAFEHVVIVAPPVALGQMRKVANAHLSPRIALWIDKDLTKEPVLKITDAVVKALQA